MRWDALRVQPEAADQPTLPTLPLALPRATVRTFDTPGFRDMTFYEIRAKSIINRVTGASQVPFTWTVNPYRGCSHACVYCLSGDTRVLLANGRTRPIAALRVGDEIYGTAQVGADRRYVPTRVLAHWSTTKPAYRVTLADGTEVVASGDHRFLTDDGWKHVTGGRNHRPQVAVGDRFHGVGAFAEPPPDTDEYRRGYLCGVTSADAGRDREPSTVYSFRLAEPAARDRVAHFLGAFGVATARAVSGQQAVAEARGRAFAVRASQLTAWPRQESTDWRKGFLAGVFDAGGTWAGSLRITLPDKAVTDAVVAALDELSFRYDRDEPHLDAGGGPHSVRLLGGLPEWLRFLHTVDPASRVGRAIDGRTVTSGAGLAVVAVEALGMELPLYDITTGTGDFIANGVVSHNCFARNTHTYLDLDAGRDFDTRVVVKVNAGELLRRELAAPRWGGEHIAMGTNVDCYQRAEGRYRLMREILAALRDAANPFSILTKGTLILRDLDLLRQAAEVTEVGVSVSVGFVDEQLWRSVEPGTPSPRRRLDVVRALADAGLSCGVLMAPVLPGLSDAPEQLDRTVAAIAEAGARSITPLALHLRPGAREWYLEWLAREHPDLLPRYQEMYRRGAYAPAAYQRELAARVRIAARRHGIGNAAAGEHRRVPTPTAPASASRETTTAHQLELL